MTGLRSGQLAAAAGVNRQTLRYYERRGLLPVPERTPGGHRVYGADAVTALRAIKGAQRLGFSLAEIAELLTVGAGGRARHGRIGLHERARVKLGEVRAQIADLVLVADTLHHAVETGCDDLVACAGAAGCPLPLTGPDSPTPPTHPERTRAGGPIPDGSPDAARR